MSLEEFIKNEKMVFLVKSCFVLLINILVIFFSKIDQNFLTKKYCRHFLDGTIAYDYLIYQLFYYKVYSQAKYEEERYFIVKRKNYLDFINSSIKILRLILHIILLLVVSGLFYSVISEKQNFIISLGESGLKIINYIFFLVQLFP